ASDVYKRQGRLGLAIATVRTNLLGEETRRDTLLDLTPRLPSPATALAFDSEGRRLFAGMQDGGVKLWRIEDGAARDEAVFQAIERRGTPVTCLSLALGDNTLLAGGADGSLQGWFETLDPAEGGGGRAFQRAHVFAPHPAPVVAIEPSRRDRSFLTADAAGHLRLHFATTERVLLERDLPVAARALAFAPKGDGFLAALDRTRAVHFGLDNRHPEISWKALFGKVWYEGYDGPAYAWQSSGGTDDFEGKFSLIPLIFGTVKGTVYALLFAVPIALLGAIYASQFLHHRIRNVLKPAIEIMAAVPSVVLGLIAGLFLAPRLEAALPATILTIAILPLLFLGSAVAWKALPARWTGRFPTGTEILFLIPIALAGAAVGGALGPVLERLLFGGDFHAWLSGTAGVRYDQRNSIVVGFAMGFAVIPILFTICEDSLSAVPQHLVSGSIACGASRWQTALWIVLPAAGSGIFSAIMVGFGRAVGETMIVLMATGNTPILDWSIWNGMRTLSANIAVEIPEAPYHGTLYRVLFLSGLLLFAITFLVNGAAEAIRLRLRRKFGNL
ncbi:MAG: ABC transporter permease subunit, partial [Candidatus Eisenbacteria bacterium]|nr:ABC transporter permease subunit [Candidatus Eisenbacteria bacterium]